jgi:hypothetical protein
MALFSLGWPRNSQVETLFNEEMAEKELKARIAEDLEGEEIWLKIRNCMRTKTLYIPLFISHLMAIDGYWSSLRVYRINLTNMDLLG